MKRSLGIIYPARIRAEIHVGETSRREFPAAWIEARERASARPFDETRPIGEVFDNAISRMSGKVWRKKEILRGVPCLHGTRIPIYQICAMLAEIGSTKRVARHLSLSEVEVKYALQFASSILEQ